MRLVYLSGSPLPSTKANAVHVMRMCHEWAQAGHDVVLVGAYGDGDVDEASIFRRYGVPQAFRIVRLRRPDVRGGGAVAYTLAARALMRTLHRAAPIDLLYGRNHLALLAAMPYARRIAFEAHQPPRGSADRWVMRRVLGAPTCAALVVISDALRALYAQERWLPGVPIVVAHDAATLPARAPSGVPPEIGYVGNLNETVGIPLLLEVARRMPEATFHVVGGLPEQVAAWQRRGGTAANLRWHGFVPHAELDAYYDRFGIGLAPYPPTHHTAGYMSPMKLFEYMAHRRVVVASDLPVCREVIEPDETGVLCPPESPEAWVAALRALRADDARRTALAEAGYAHCAEAYTWEARAASILDAVMDAPPR